MKRRILVWIMGHVLSGWDGSNPLLNPTNLCECRHELLYLIFVDIFFLPVYQM